MTCDKCKGLGSVVKTDHGKFEILTCPCQRHISLLNHWFKESNNNKIYQVTHIETGWLIVVEYYTTGECYKRMLNQLQFSLDLDEELLTPFPKPDYQCQNCNKSTVDYLINYRYQCYECKESLL